MSKSQENIINGYKIQSLDQISRQSNQRDIICRLNEELSKSCNIQSTVSSLCKINTMSQNTINHLSKFLNSKDCHNFRLARWFHYQSIPNFSHFSIQYKNMHNVKLNNYLMFNNNLTKSIKISGIKLNIVEEIDSIIKASFRVCKCKSVSNSNNGNLDSESKNDHNNNNDIVSVESALKSIEINEKNIEMAANLNPIKVINESIKNNNRNKRFDSCFVGLNRLYWKITRVSAELFFVEQLPLENPIFGRTKVVHFFKSGKNNYNSNNNNNNNNNNKNEYATEFKIHKDCYDHWKCFENIAPNLNDLSIIYDIIPREANDGLCCNQLNLFSKTLTYAIMNKESLYCQRLTKLELDCLQIDCFNLECHPIYLLSNMRQLETLKLRFGINYDPPRCDE